MIKRGFRLVLVFVLCASAFSCAMPPPTKTGRIPPAGPMTEFIDIYRGPLHHLDAVRDGQCPMYPSCSAYALQAIDKHGPLMGWFMACDRLMRCGRDTLKYVPKIPVNGKWKYLDPISANDFWWTPEKNSRRPDTFREKTEVRWETKQKSTNP